MAPSAERPVRIPISFPPEQYEWLREAAFRRHTAMADIVREALSEYRVRTDPQLPLPMRPGRGAG